MSAPKDGGPAYPQHGWSSDPATVARMSEKQGMTLRDYFAAQVLIGICVSYMPRLDEMHERAGRCYAMADAMLAAREAKQ